jgi:hypothetical protein
MPIKRRLSSGFRLHKAKIQTQSLLKTTFQTSFNIEHGTGMKWREMFINSRLFIDVNNFFICMISLEQIILMG